MTKPKTILSGCVAAILSLGSFGCAPAQNSSAQNSSAPQAALQSTPVTTPSISPSQTRLDPPAGYVANKNTVVMLGMIHRAHVESETYGLDVVEALIREINPDYVLTEIPPDRLAGAVKGFAETGEVTEQRVRVFPEYRDVLFPLTEEMDFKIIPTAAWSRGMADYRRDAMGKIRSNPERKDDWDAYIAANEQANEKMADRRDDPYFIHSDEYDAITKANLSVYGTRFAEDIGRGDWERINAAHYKLIEAALENHAGEGATMLITYGAGHKYWFLEQLRQRDDIILINPVEYLDKIKAP